MTTDALIVGGGLNGPLAALALARAGLRATVVDARPRAAFDGAFDGRAYAVALGSVRMLQALGLWERLAPDAQPIEAIRASDGRAGEGASRLHLAFDAAEIGEAFMGQMVEDRHLRPALLDAVAAEPLVEARYGAAVTAQAAGSAEASVTLETGETLAARLLIGADGLGSGIARRAGIRRVGRAYAQAALTCAIAHDRPHHATAHQFFMPAGPLAILPLRDDRCSLVWTEAADTAAALTALPDDAYLDLLRPRVGDFLGDFRLAGARHAYPLALSLAQDLAAPRLALIGDAAHGIHPIAGQGLNLGFKDIAALAEVLTEARRRGEDIGAPDVLARYARWRRLDTVAMGVATDAVNRLFSNDDPLLRAARRLGMGAVSALGPARRAFIRQAAGLAGDVPPLMRAA